MTWTVKCPYHRNDKCESPINCTKLCRKHPGYLTAKMARLAKRPLYERRDRDKEE